MFSKTNNIEMMKTRYKETNQLLLSFLTSQCGEIWWANRRLGPGSHDISDSATPGPRASEQRKTQSENYFSIVLGYFSFPFRTQSLWLLFYSIIWWLLNLVDDLENAIRWFNEAKFGSIRVELGGSGPVRPRRCFLCPAQSQTKPAELPALQTQKEIINQ